MKYEWLNADSRKFLKGGYLEDGESAEQRIDKIAHRAQELLLEMWGPKGKLPPDILKNFAEKFKECMSHGWFSLSTPVWSNFGKSRALPVSCFGSMVSDSCASIIYSDAEVSTMTQRSRHWDFDVDDDFNKSAIFTKAEIAAMTQKGGGTSVYLGNLRPRGAPISTGGQSDGPMSFAKLFETSANILKQGATRRGSLAAYLPIDHPDIEEFLRVRHEGSELQDIFTGVCVSDEWMNDMVDGDSAKRKLWGKVLKARSTTGVPYIFFSGNVNKYKPQVYIDKGMEIYASNLCSEIFIPSSEDESFVCVLSSMNLLHYDEWKNTDAVRILLMFLDAVNEEFVQKSAEVKFMERAHRFAKNHRALGLGVLGWHSYLQKNMIPFGSWIAMGRTEEIFALLQRETQSASQDMAQWFGEPEVLKGYGRRNTTHMALPPTKSSSFILGGGTLSQSTEPYHSNYFMDDKAKIQVVSKNIYLRELLQYYGKGSDEVWDSISMHNGSVQHLKFLEDDEKEVFKTFAEISQMDIVKQAIIRRPYIDQGESLNLMIHPKCPVKDENQLYIEGWKGGLKSFYYRKTFNAASEFKRELVTCSSCEG